MSRMRQTDSGLRCPDRIWGGRSSAYSLL